MTAPSVSVVMSVYNGERYLRESVESILSQTYKEFEFIIVNDGSQDGTADILDGYQKADGRIRIHHQTNQRLTSALNTGCGLARGSYIARMDDDDIALPSRLERQVAFLEEYPRVALLGSSVNIVDAGGKHLYVLEFPTKDEAIKEWLFESHQVAFSHPVMAFRTEAFRAIGGYTPTVTAAEDYDLAVRMAERWEVANLPEPLLKMRRHANSLSVKDTRRMVISILGSWAASKVRRAGGEDPRGSGDAVSLDLLKRLGVSDAVLEQSLMGVYLHWIEVLLQASDKAGAVKVMREGLQSQPWKHIDKSRIANTWLTGARIHFEQGRYLQGIGFLARALAARPAIAGRPFKRFAGRLGLLNTAGGKL